MKVQIERRLQDLFGDRLIRVVWGAEKDDLLEGTVILHGGFTIQDRYAVADLRSDMIEASNFAVTVDVDLASEPIKEATI